MTRGSTTKAVGVLSVICICSALVRAAAYDVSGHHYIISSILATAPPTSNNAASTAVAVNPYQRLESFCVELPDLVPELDAVTQRFHVLYR